MNILITGGASGLGEAITRNLASNSANTVYFTYSKSDSLATTLCAEFKNCSSIKCDFSNPLEVDGLLISIQNLDLDVLINNAYVGDVRHSHFFKNKIDQFKNDFDNNILPTIQITQTCIKIFKKKKKGKIITILSSILINKPSIGSSIYTANKAYLASLVKSWANECIPYNITSNSVSPALMQTQINDDLDERIIEQIIQNHPLKKILTKEEVAESVAFLVYSSNQINGLDIVINAGFELK